MPLYTEEWVEELLSRIFSILANLEAPETRSDHAAVQGNASAPASDSASFLLEGNSMFRYIRPLASHLRSRVRRNKKMLKIQFNEI